MRRREVAAGKEEVADVARVEAAIRDAVGRRRFVEDGRLARIVDGVGVVVVHRPAAVRDDVVEAAARQDVILRQDVIAHVADVLALAGQAADPLQLPALAAAIRVILDVGPDAVADLEQLVAVRVGVGDGVARAAHLQPPEVVAFGLQGAVGQVALVVLDGPRRRDEGPVLSFGDLAQLDQDRVAHRLAVCHRRRVRLVELVAALAAPAILRAGDAQHRVAGAIGEVARLDDVPRLRVELPRADAGDAVAVHLNVVARAGEQHLQAGLETRLFVEHRVPDRVVEGGVAVVVVEHDLFEDARLFVVRPARAADPHADLGRGVAAQHGAILDQDHPAAVARRRHRGAQPRDPPADHAQVGLVLDDVEVSFGCHVLSFCAM